MFGRIIRAVEQAAPLVLTAPDITRLSNFPSTPSTTLFGTTTTTHATPGTDTAWQLIFSDIGAQNCYGIHIFNGNITSTPTTQTDVLIDIAIGDVGGGNEAVIASNLMFGSCATLAGRSMWFPLGFISNVSVSFRARSNEASKVVYIGMTLECCDTQPWFTYSACDSYGVTGSTCRGTAHTAGNSSADSAFASLGTTLSQDYKAAFLNVGIGTSTSQTSLMYQFELGKSGSAIAGAKWDFNISSLEAVAGPYPARPIWKPLSLTSGSQMQVRGRTSGTASALDLGLYCLR